MITESKIEKKITFFKYEKIDSKTVDEAIDFVSKQSAVLIDNVKINMSNRTPSSISIGINTGSVRDYKLVPSKYYYFRGKELMSVDKVEDVNFW